MNKMHLDLENTLCEQKSAKEWLYSFQLLLDPCNGRLELYQIPFDGAQEEEGEASVLGQWKEAEGLWLSGMRVRTWGHGKRARSEQTQNRWSSIWDTGVSFSHFLCIGLADSL